MDINQIKLDNKFKLVEASAGTGKSFTLSHLVLRNNNFDKLSFRLYGPLINALKK